jgi:hypothetical protein
VEELHAVTGIVLLYKGRSISLLDPIQGRIDAILYSSAYAKTRVVPGSIISYSVTRDRYQNIVLQNVEIDHVPLCWGRHDIHLLHYLLEICYYFIPQGAGCKNTFTLFITLFKNFSSFKTVLDKKNVLCKILSELGMYPHVPEIQSCVEELLEKPVDNLMARDLQLTNEDLLDQWLLWCIQTHPQGKWFKAIPTLLKSGAQ